jgi:enterochelin esterase-like enzyme
MVSESFKTIRITRYKIYSTFLQREVTIDLYLPDGVSGQQGVSLLLINDGQNLEEMNFGALHDRLLTSKKLQPLVCAGIHAGEDRKNEYGTARQPDFAGRGAKAPAYRSFILEEALPFIYSLTSINKFATIGFAGFSLGGLTALDLVWTHPEIFSIAGVFSGSLWWRSKDIGPGYSDDRDRIMHQAIRNGRYQAGQRFYFTTGSLDETADRNNNGIIDSIDDTEDLIRELQKLGYQRETDIMYINYEDGAHDIKTWGTAMPGFLTWGWGRQEAGG